MSVAAAAGLSHVAAARRWVLASTTFVWATAAWLVWQTHGPAAHAHPGQHGAVTLGSWVAATLLWQAMMVAMMAPVVLPWLRLAPILSPEAGSPARVVATFASGYFVAWLGYSSVAALLQVVLAREQLLDDGRLAAALGGGVLVVAGAFQFSALKQACLKHCRSPFAYLLTSWRNGPPNPFRIGLAHGGYCVACCWALMAVAFATGVTSVPWMAAIAIVAAVEQVVPHGVWWSRVWGVGLVGAGFARAMAVL